VTTPAPAPATRRWRPERPVDVRATLSAFLRGLDDPCHRWAADGALWRATRTPAGPVTLRIVVRPPDGEVLGTAWGPGTEWALDALPDLLGAGDVTAPAFRPLAEHPRLVAAARARPGWRVPRTAAVFESLVMAVIEQVVTGKESGRSYRLLVRRFGEPAPGPVPPPPAGRADAPPRPLLVQPTPRQWALVPSWEWLRAGVEQRRSSTVVRAARVADRLEATATAPPDLAEAALRTVPGIGRWTAAEIRQRAHGDPDAFSFDDYHVAKDVSWALTGRVLDDDACAEVIAPYAGHRYRVQRLLELAGAHRPRRGPRMTLPTHTPIATGGFG
jgi:3-methyladenine DNA glycosylase/8-oxoguanine DNA glycosylase